MDRDNFTVRCTCWVQQIFTVRYDCVFEQFCTLRDLEGEILIALLKIVNHDIIPDDHGNQIFFTDVNEFHFK